MAPIRIGFIGLSAGQSWSVWAHIPYLKDNSKYTIVALCNTSVTSAKAAIKAHGLPESTKAYGSPQDLANDPDVELVVCSVRVPQHYETIMPSLKAGKDIYCEWPLAKDLAEAEEFVSVAKSKGVRTMVGLQSLQAPHVRKVKELVDSGKIGKVLSVTFVGNSGFSGLKEPDFAEYCQDKENGANMLTIYAMHSLEAILYSLGEIKSFGSIIETKHQNVKIVDGKGEFLRTVSRTAPDQILLQGHLESGALLSYHMRGGAAFGGNEGLIWRIFGETGEIQVIASNTYLQAGAEDTTIRLHDHATGETTKIEPAEDEFSKLPLFSQNVARIYGAFADGKKDGYMDWEHALLRHKLVDEIYRREVAGKQETPAGYIKKQD